MVFCGNRELGEIYAVDFRFVIESIGKWLAEIQWLPQKHTGQASPLSLSPRRAGGWAKANCTVLLKNQTTVFRCLFWTSWGTSRYCTILSGTRGFMTRTGKSDVGRPCLWKLVNIWQKQCDLWLIQKHTVKDWLNSCFCVIRLMAWKRLANLFQHGIFMVENWRRVATNAWFKRPLFEGFCQFGFVGLAGTAGRSTFRGEACSMLGRFLNGDKTYRIRWSEWWNWQRSKKNF